MVTTGAVGTCKAPVKSSSPTNQHPAFLRAGCPSCYPTNSVKALKGKQPTDSVKRNVFVHDAAKRSLTDNRIYSIEGIPLTKVEQLYKWHSVD